jgi:hypothetical protein
MRLIRRRPLSALAVVAAGTVVVAATAIAYPTPNQGGTITGVQVVRETADISTNSDTAAPNRVRADSYQNSTCEPLSSPVSWSTCGQPAVDRFSCPERVERFGQLAAGLRSGLGRRRSR